MSVRATTVLVVLVLLLGACGGGDPTVDVGDGDSTTGGDATPVGDWVLVEGIDVPAGARVTMSVSQDGQLSGTAACNSYSGTVDTRDGGFVVGELGATEMGCEPPLMETEQAWLGALVDVTDAEVVDGRLRLVPDGLLLEPLEPVPTAELVGTTWVLESLLTGHGPDGAASSVQGDRAVLLLAGDGTVTASTGCREFTGEWVERGDEVLLTTFGAVAGAGPCPPDLARQDDHVVTVLGDGFRAEVDGDRLTLTDGELGLAYRSGEAGGAIAPESSGTDMAVVLVGTSWSVVEGAVAGRAFPDGGQRPAITFGEEGDLNGTDTCNRFGGSYAVDARGNAMIDGVQATRQRCDDNPFEPLAEALARVEAITLVDDGMLSMTGRDIELLLAPR